MITKIRLASSLETDSVSNGTGLRMVVWMQGCFFNCEGCHNQESLDLDGGSVYSIDEILDQIKDHMPSDGITFSGGDPLLQSSALKVMLPRIKELGLNVWLYSGDVYENLIKKEYFKGVVDYIDVLVDGPFVVSKMNLSLTYRGSSNQRLVDIPKTLEQRTVVLHALEEENE